MLSRLDIFDDPKWMKEALKASSVGLWRIVMDSGTGRGEMLANDTMLELLGLTEHPSPEECYRHWSANIPKEYLPRVTQCLNRLLFRQAEVEYLWDHPHRGRIYIRCGGRPIGRNGGQIELMGYHQDISELHQARLSLQESRRQLARANIDSLTGIPVRRHFFEQAENALKTLGKPPEAVHFLMADIDNFKQVNDAYSHMAGDAVLHEFAGRFREQIGKGHISGRFGGEEFVVLLRGMSGADVMDLAERIRRTVADTPILFEGQPLSITVSMGIGRLGAEDILCSETPSALMNIGLHRADKALYKAKSEGRNRTCYCSDDEHVDDCTCR